MKRFLVPAFFVIHANSSDEADAIASIGQCKANDFFIFRDHGEKKDPVHSDILLLDEWLATREIQIEPESTELPHTYSDMSLDEKLRLFLDLKKRLDYCKTSGKWGWSNVDEVPAMMFNSAMEAIDDAIKPYVNVDGGYGN